MLALNERWLVIGRHATRTAAGERSHLERLFTHFKGHKGRSFNLPLTRRLGHDAMLYPDLGYSSRGAYDICTRHVWTHAIS